ncbi:MAG: integrase [Methanosphaera stadtmanae]|jgi:site-specific recombinase XerD|nr:integrase [Methanosphaera stadtmanae]
MYKSNYFEKFCFERNIKDSTKKGYVSSLENYEKFNKKSMDVLIREAITEEERIANINNRKIKKRLINYRRYLIDCDFSSNTIRTYFSKILTFYKHYGVEIPKLPDIKYKQNYQTNYLDLPTRENIEEALKIVPLSFKALILFMSSSGTAKAETLSITVGDFINATEDYHKGNSLDKKLYELSLCEDIVPTFYIKRKKTNKFYYTFCSPEASSYIVEYLRSRNNLKYSDKLFPFSSSTVLNKFEHINDHMKWGFKGKYRFFRTHALRKYHASNLGLSAEYIDALQGRGRSTVHEAYIKTNPEKLKQLYINHMNNILIYRDNIPQKKKEEIINITINVFLSDTQINLY